jgi:DNA-binding IscR family transcriptional regulator
VPAQSGEAHTQLSPTRLLHPGYSPFRLDDKNRTATVLFMAANSLLASAVQILCFIAYVGDEGTNAERAAKSLKTNPVVVRRLLKLLEAKGLVSIRQGRHGGVALDRPPEQITLQDIHEAVEGGAPLFALRERGNVRCPVNQAMTEVLTPVFKAADAAVADTFKRTRLTELIDKIA